MNQNQAPINLELAVRRFEISEQICITGPNQMISKLSSHFPDASGDDILFVWLDSEDVAVAIDQLDTGKHFQAKYEVPNAAEKSEKLVVVCRSNDRDSAAEIANSINLSATKPLDILLVADGRWWSLLCTNIDCCPADGRLLPAQINVEDSELNERNEIWLEWLNIFNLFENNSTYEIEKSREQMLRKSLDDLAIRDCLLNHLAINVESQNTWREIFARFLDTEEKLNNHVFYCLLAAINFSSGDLNKADFYTRQSLLISPTYSLSLLMQHGLEIQMDTKKVIAAFTHFSAEELLRNTPKRK